MSKPHIIFIFSDQHNPMVNGYEGDPIARTPNLDALAASGAWFRNCYCGAPLCVPSRISMLTGLTPAHNGVFNNRQSLASDIPTMAHTLTIAGYQTTLCGRMHFVGPDQRHGFTRRLVGDFTCNRLGVGNPSMGKWHSTTGQSVGGVLRSGAGHTNVMAYDEAVTEAAVKEIRRSVAGGHTLFMTVGFYGPHCPFICPRDLFDHYMDALPPPSIPENFLETAHPAVRNWFERRKMIAVDPEAIQRARAAYYGLVEINDRHVGTIIDAVHNAMGAENALVVYASDHGDMIGHNGLFWKSNFYEGSVRVPVVAAYPGTIAQRRVITHPTSLLDLPSTFNDFGDAPALPETDGESWRNDLTSAEYKPRDRAVVSMLGDVKGDAPAAMIRRDKWKLVRHHGHETVQLFDLDADPDEQNDLGSDPAFSEISGKLDAELANHWDGAKIQAMVMRANQRTEITHVHSERIPHAPEDDEVWVGDMADNWLEDSSVFP